MTMNVRLNRLVNDDRFIRFIIGAILLNGLLIGIDTYKSTALSTTIQQVLLAIFTAEVLLRFGGRASVKSYLLDPWNLFDIVIVGSAFVPAVPAYFTVFRVLRVLRVLRLVRSMPQLRIIVEVLGRSVKSMFYICLLMLIAFYVYALVGVELFGPKGQAETFAEQEFQNYSNLHEAFFSLFRSMTCEDWTDLRYRGVQAGGNYWVVTIYHVSWIMVSTFLMINLVVGAILTNYQEVQEDEVNSTLTGDERELQDAIEQLQAVLKKRKSLERDTPEQTP